MGMYDTAPDPSNTAGAKPSKEALWQDIRVMFAESGYSTEQARHFVQSVCSPYNPKFERPFRVNVHGPGKVDVQRWQEPYRERLMQCIALYLRMSESDRNMLHAGVEDGVKWRGEPIAQYVDIVNETLTMREIGLDAYKQRNAEKLAGILPPNKVDAA